MKILLSTLTAAALLAGVAAWTVPSPTHEYVVIIDKNFSPDLIDVKIGDTVTWKNFDSDSHTVTSEFRPAAPQEGGFDSGVILSGGSYPVTFLKMGRYKYYCQLHREKIGTVVVTP